MLTNVTFSMTINGTSGAYAQQVLVGDFNGDGVADLAVPFSYGNGTQPGPILFFTGDGHGGFVDSTTALFSGQVPTAIYDARILSGDFNNDGRSDVVGLDFGQDAAPFAGGQSELFLSSPGGMTIATANLPQRLLQTHGGMVGDINGDGNLDVILLNLNTHNVSAVEILIGDGTGHFQEMDQLAPASYQAAGYNPGNTWGGLVDVNGDGHADLILGTWSASSLPSEVYLNDGHGSFANATPIPLPDSGVQPHPSVVQVQPIDLNSDGHPDLILSVTNSGTPGTSDFYTVGYLQFLINDGTGHFHDETAARLPQSTSPNGGWIKFIQAIDLTGDGAADLVTQWWTPNGIFTKIYLNDGAGDFTLVPQTIIGEATAIPNADGQGHVEFAVVVGNQLQMVSDDLPQFSNTVFQKIQNDFLAITRIPQAVAQGTTITNAIDAGTQSETQYVNSLLSQVANTTIPAVAVEASMYGVTGTSAEITSLTTNFLPAQIANALNHGLNPQVYACEALGLVFAFGNETSSTAFANNFGPSNGAMPNSTAGDAAFAAAASSTIFGAASTANLVNVLGNFVSNWKGFYTSAGIPGNATPTADQIDLASRGAAWGDMVGVALANNLGPLNGQVVNFLDDAAQGTAIYGASLVGQPIHQPFV